MTFKDTANFVLTHTHTPIIDQYTGKLFFVVCGDNDFVGYWSEDDICEDMGWSAEEVAEILALESGETLQSYSSSLHTIVCVK